MQPDPQYFKYLWKTIDVCLFDILKTPKKERIDLKNKHNEAIDALDGKMWKLQQEINCYRSFIRELLSLVELTKEKLGIKK